MKPSFAVIILSWNRLKELKKCLEHLLPEMTPDVQIRIWDNGSTDGTVDWLKTMEAGHTNVKVHYASSNQGVCAPRNLLARETIADYLIFLDSDSYLQTTNALEIMQNACSKNTTTAAWSFEVIMRSGKRAWPYARNEKQHAQTCFKIVKLDGGACLIRRSAFLKAGGFPEHFGYGAEDLYLARALISAGFDVEYLPHISIFHDAAETGRTKDQFITMARNHLWIPMELYPMPHAIISTIHMSLCYLSDAVHEKRMADFRVAMKKALSGFEARRRRPMSRQDWKRFRSAIIEDRKTAHQKDL